MENVTKQVKKGDMLDEIKETTRQYEDGAITMEEFFNKLLDIMACNVDLLKEEIIRLHPTVQYLSCVKEQGY